MLPSSPFPPFPGQLGGSPPVPPAHGAACPKNYTKRDMALALEALKSKKLSLSRASEVYGIPPTTLWQRANRMGIPTPKKDTTSKNWSDEDLESALNALRRKEISANKASKVYKIPSSTLYKIARKEGIELAQPFNAVATTWTQEDLSSALEAIKAGTPVQKAAAEYGIPSGTLYGRCKKVGIELSKHASVGPTCCFGDLPSLPPDPLERGGHGGRPGRRQDGHHVNQPGKAPPRPPGPGGTAVLAVRQPAAWHAGQTKPQLKTSGNSRGFL